MKVVLKTPAKSLNFSMWTQREWGKEGKKSRRKNKASRKWKNSEILHRYVIKQEQLTNNIIGLNI